MRKIFLIIIGVLMAAYSPEDLARALEGGAGASAKPPNAMQELHQFADELLAKVSRGELTIDQATAIMAPRLGKKNEETGYYSPTPSNGQIDLRAPNDPFAIRQTMKQQGWEQ